jgi:glycosyltransferase involved in cell wall biosynthesis
MPARELGMCSFFCEHFGLKGKMSLLPRKVRRLAICFSVLAIVLVAYVGVLHVVKFGTNTVPKRRIAEATATTVENLLSSQQPSSRVLIVTSELAHIDRMGGISTATSNIVWAMRALNASVDILYVSYPWCIAPSCNFHDAIKFYRQYGVRVFMCSIKESDNIGWIDGSLIVKRAWKTHQWLLMRQHMYDLVLFHEYDAASFYAMSAKKMGMAYMHLPFALYLHGSTEPIHDSTDRLAPDFNSLVQYYMERFVIENADVLVTPSEHLISKYRKMYTVAGSHIICPIPMADSLEAARSAISAPNFLRARDDIIDSSGLATTSSLESLANAAHDIAARVMDMGFLNSKAQSNVRHSGRHFYYFSKFSAAKGCRMFVEALDILARGVCNGSTPQLCPERVVFIGNDVHTEFPTGGYRGYVTAHSKDHAWPFAWDIMENLVTHEAIDVICTSGPAAVAFFHKYFLTQTS